jgi:BlaR1 peptidase M56
MFYALCAAVCLAVMFIVIVGTLLLSSGGAWVLRRFLRSLEAGTLANLLFAVRLLPFIAALFFISGFVLPAFLRFEPRHTSEGVGLKLILLSALGALVLGTIAARWYRVRRATTVVRNQWLTRAQALPLSYGSAPVFAVEQGRGLVAVLGIFRPRIFVARKVLSVLTPAELAAVLAHELGHVNAFDNLKQTLLKITQPPQWLRSLKSLDQLWVNASEMAADEAALARGNAVEDLASALVKVSRLGETMPTRIAACHLVPDTSCSAVGERVLHLQDLLNGQGQPLTRTSRPGLRSLSFIAGAVIVYATVLQFSLPIVHEALEWLVR